MEGNAEFVWTVHRQHDPPEDCLLTSSCEATWQNTARRSMLAPLSGLFQRTHLWRTDLGNKADAADRERRCSFHVETCFSACLLVLTHRVSYMTTYFKLFIHGFKVLFSHLRTFIRRTSIKLFCFLSSSWVVYLLRRSFPNWLFSSCPEELYMFHGFLRHLEWKKN